jgi:ATP-dependent helicase HrpA
VETSRVFGRIAAAINPRAVERCAGHLCGKVYDSEHFDARSGYVRAREKVILGGLTVNAGRQVDFGRCNPVAAREIFIREGILSGEVYLPGTPLENFTDAKAELQTLELRMRRLGQLYDEVSAEKFFCSAIPPEVNSVKSLKLFMKQHPQALDLDPQELMLEQFIKFDAGDYPAHLEFNKVKFKLSYTFEPGSKFDGITLLVKESMLNILPDRALDYPIPGYYAEFGEALLRTLPKELRRKFDGGIPETARRFADYLKNDLSARQLPPEEAMAEFLLYDSETELPPRSFNFDKLPEYLKLKLGVLNEHGQLKERLHELPGRIKSNSKLSVSLPGAARHIAEKLTSWPGDAGIIPESVEIPPRSGRISYPALSVENGAVSKQLFLKLNEARRHHRKGVLKLFVLANEQHMKLLKRSLRFSNELKMSFLLNTSASDFENDLLMAALENAAGCDLWEVRSEEKFEQICETMKMNWSDHINDLIAALEKYASEASAIRAVARRAKDNAVPITEHLDLLFSPGFLRRPAVSTDYPRYLRALKMRAERLVNAPARDAEKGEVLEEYLDKFYAAWDTVGSLADSDGLYEFWQLLEECRIAIFAPEVRCTIKSPVAKLPDFWKNLRF